MQRGGKRRGAGRPKGTGKFTETTKAVRVPESMVERIMEYAYAGGFKLPLYALKTSTDPSVSETETTATIERMIDLGHYLISDQSSTFLIQVNDNSMSEAGIHPDDILIIDRSIEALHNKFVIAKINDELLVRRLYNKNNKIRLLPENSRFSPIDFESKESLVILGVVTNLIHSL